MKMKPMLGDETEAGIPGVSFAARSELDFDENLMRNISILSKKRQKNRRLRRASLRRRLRRAAAQTPFTPELCPTT